MAVVIPLTKPACGEAQELGPYQSPADREYIERLKWAERAAPYSAKARTFLDNQAAELDRLEALEAEEG